MASDVRIAVTLACTECKHRNYQTNKSKRNDPERLAHQRIVACICHQVGEDALSL